MTVKELIIDLCAGFELDDEVVIALPDSDQRFQFSDELFTVNRTNKDGKYAVIKLDRP